MCFPGTPLNHLSISPKTKGCHITIYYYIAINPRQTLQNNASYKNLKMQLSICRLTITSLSQYFYLVNPFLKKIIFHQKGVLLDHLFLVYDNLIQKFSSLKFQVILVLYFPLDPYNISILNHIQPLHK